MLLPTVTYGELRKRFLKDVELGVESSDNPLHDPKFRAESGDKANEDYVYPEDAAEWLKAFPEDEPKPVTAAGDPEEPVEEMEFPTPLYFTVDDNDNVLELVKADDEGLFIRIDGEWVDISDEDEFPTVYEQTIKFANDESVGKWDSEFEDNDALKLEDVQDYIIE